MRTTLNMAVVATASVVALAGCGSKDKASTTPTPVTSTQAVVPPSSAAPATTGTPSAPTTPGGSTASSPKAVWAKQLCTALTGKVKPVQPPTVASTSPSDTQKSLITFLGSVIDAEGVQIATLKQVGPPPGAAAKKDWTAAVKHLRGIRKKITKVQTDLQATNPSNAKALQTEITALGAKLKILASYQGPVVDLSTGKAIGPAVTADPTCKAVA